MALKLTKNFALLYGIMLGDGCLSLFNNRKKYISISGSLVDDKPFFENQSLILSLLCCQRNRSCFENHSAH